MYFFSNFNNLQCYKGQTQILSSLIHKMMNGSFLRQIFAGVPLFIHITFTKNDVIAITAQRRRKKTLSIFDFYNGLFLFFLLSIHFDEIY